jgi:hypothetical protein
MISAGLYAIVQRLGQTREVALHSRLKSGHLLPEATTPQTAPISALPPAAQRAEVYRRP